MLGGRVFDKSTQINLTWQPMSLKQLWEQKPSEVGGPTLYENQADEHCYFWAATLLSQKCYLLKEKPIAFRLCFVLDRETNFKKICQTRLRGVKVTCWAAQTSKWLHFSR